MSENLKKLHHDYSSTGKALMIEWRGTLRILQYNDEKCVGAYKLDEDTYMSLPDGIVFLYD